jgi:hypothetical protein
MSMMECGDWELELVGKLVYTNKLFIFQKRKGIP